MEVGQHPIINGGALNAESMPPPLGGGRDHRSRLGQPVVDVRERHPNGRKVRTDALPEHLEYRDSGCDLAPSCLRCPLVRCRYDEPGGARALLQSSRDEAVQRRREEGAGIDGLAAEFDLSRRSVFRILRRRRISLGLMARGRANGGPPSGGGALAPARPNAHGGSHG